MHENDRRLRDVLTQIAALASAAVNGSEDEGDKHGDEQAPAGAPQQDQLACTPKTLPKRLLVKAAETAAKINPVNAPAFGPLAEVTGDLQLEPLRIAVLTAKYWGPTPRRLTVSFMERTPGPRRGVSRSSRRKGRVMSGSPGVRVGTGRISGPTFCSSRGIARP
jgi:hypothetical protein